VGTRRSLARADIPYQPDVTIAPLYNRIALDPELPGLVIDLPALD
jgi:hypothetical protein